MNAVPVIFFFYFVEVYNFLFHFASVVFIVLISFAILLIILHYIISSALIT